MDSTGSSGCAAEHLRTPISNPHNAEPLYQWTMIDIPSPTLQKPPPALLSLLGTSLVLRQTAPYLSVSAIYALAATCKAFHHLVFTSPEFFRYLDLSPVKAAMIDMPPLDKGGINWRAERMDEALTEDEFYSGPIRGIMYNLERRNVLRSVSTMVLDGLAVPAEVVREIVTEQRYNVRILSIREAKHLNERKLMQMLKYAVRPSRPAGTPRLKGLYVFGPMDPVRDERSRDELLSGRRRSPTRYPDSDPRGVMDALGAQLGAEWNRKSQQAMASQLSQTHDRWWRSSGHMFRKTPLAEWAGTLKACEGIIAFDAVLCRGPRHDAPSMGCSTEEQRHLYLPQAVATVALGPVGCVKCGSCPEGLVSFEFSPSHHLPLLAPPPLHSTSVRSARKPVYAAEAESSNMVARCTQCLRGRWCQRCHKWWCESCYQPTTRTALQQLEHIQQAMLSNQDGEGEAQQEIKVHMGLCVDPCLVGDLTSGAGTGGMSG